MIKAVPTHVSSREPPFRGHTVSVAESLSVIEEEGKLTTAANQPGERVLLCLDSHKVIKDVCGLK